VPDIAAG